MSWMERVALISSIPGFHNYLLDYTSQFEYKLDHHGKLWMRSRDQINPITIKKGQRLRTTISSWHLFEGTGVPSDRHGHSILSDNEKIIAFKVAGEVVIFISNTRDVYMYKPIDVPSIISPIVSKKKLGQPIRSSLKIPLDARCFALSVSVSGKLPRRRSSEIMGEADIVRYAADGAGVNHYAAHCTSIYVVERTGRVIYLWDTGLPAGSWQRGLLSPLGGMTQIQDISVAGSTILVSCLDQNGYLRYFTKRFDYEKDGQAPAITYSYDKSRASEEDNTFGNEVRILPSDIWHEVKTPLILSKSQGLHSTISIEIIGSGDNSRILKIFGTNEYGELGYYYKKIDGQQWRFTTVQLEPGKLVPPVIYHKYMPLQPLKHNYQSYINFDGRSIKVDLLGFSIFNSAEDVVDMVLTDIVTGEIAVLDLRAVDGWCFHYLKPGLEDLVGASDGIPKWLSATLIISDEYKTKLSPLSDIIRNNFLRYHHKNRGFSIIATDNILELDTTDRRFNFSFERVYNAGEFKHSFYLDKVKNILQNNPQTFEQCYSLIKYSEQLLQDLVALNKELRHRFYGFYLSYIGGEAARVSFMHPVTKVVNSMHKLLHNQGRVVFGAFDHRIAADHLGEKAMHDLKQAFYYNSKICKRVAQGANPDFEQAKNILLSRIKQLKVMLRLFITQRVSPHNMLYRSISYIATLPGKERGEEVERQDFLVCLKN